MNRLDSRYLALGDCFAQVFPVAGNIRYRLTVGLPWFDNCEATGANAFDLEIRPRSTKGGQPAQKTVVVTRGENGLTANPASVSIEAGDTVLWYTTDKTLAGFSVVGAGDKFHFNSASITGESLYTHAFGAPGAYNWVDAMGGKARGSISVKPFNASAGSARKEWLEHLKKPVAVEIDGDKVSNPKLEIIVGQTVFWHVKKSSGLSITDASLLRSK